VGNPARVFQGMWEGGRRPAFHRPAGDRPGRGGPGGRGDGFPQVHSREGADPPISCRLSVGGFPMPVALLRQSGPAENQRSRHPLTPFAHSALKSAKLPGFEIAWVKLQETNEECLGCHFGLGLKPAEDLWPHVSEWVPPCAPGTGGLRWFLVSWPYFTCFPKFRKFIQELLEILGDDLVLSASVRTGQRSYPRLRTAKFFEQHHRVKAPA